MKTQSLVIKDQVSNLHYPQGRPLDFCFLVSGGGGPLRFLYYVAQKLDLNIRIVKVVGDRACGAVDFAVRKGIPAAIIPYQRTDEQDLISELSEISCDIIVTNYNKIIGTGVLSCTKACFVNMHPSLLPAYSGLIGMETVDCARKDRARFLGGTCHKVIEKVDAGPVLQQVKGEANWNVPIGQMYDLTFRATCLSLLNWLIPLEDSQVSLRVSGNFSFDPPCRFDFSRIGEDFWSLVKSGE